MRAAPWLLLLLRLCASLEQDCILGIVGQPLSLPCFHTVQLSAFENVSIEWRRDEKVVLRAAWGEDGNVETCSVNHASISSDAARTGDFSLTLPAVHPKEDRMQYSLSFISGENTSAILCTVCLQIAAKFSAPLLVKDMAAEGTEMTFLCHSSGGYPQPAVYWLINNTENPPEGSVRTLAASLPNSHLYNITSHLTVNVSNDSSVSCIIENPSTNENLTSTSYARSESTAVNRAAEAMWIFSTALCVVVGILVAAGIAYQIHLDKISKQRKHKYQEQQRGYRRRRPYRDDAEATKLEPKETDV
ncbi:ICOS ligand-like [Cololabis saira]|uniref:ICOS ligand-like n=1 Tax=Cololabis saira TaxID=129043 RepID=UPI002AD49CDD|nr:ICOS ligand-like [Cololabis saira]